MRGGGEGGITRLLCLLSAAAVASQLPPSPGMLTWPGLGCRTLCLHPLTHHLAWPGLQDAVPAPPYTPPGLACRMSDLALPFLLLIEDDALAFTCFSRLMAKVGGPLFACGC